MKRSTSQPLNPRTDPFDGVVPGPTPDASARWPGVAHPGLRRCGPGRTALAVLALASAGCGREPADVHQGDDPSISGAVEFTAELGDTVELGVGDEVRIEGTDLRVAFERLLQDYRCAIDVVCVWQGDAEVLVRITADGEGASYELRVNREPRSVRVGAFTVALVDVLPYPVHDPLADPAPPTIEVTVAVDGGPA